MRRQWDVINQLVQLKNFNCYLVKNSESYLLLPHSSGSVHNCTYGKQKTDKAQNLRAKTVYVDGIPEQKTVNSVIAAESKQSATM